MKRKITKRGREIKFKGKNQWYTKQMLTTSWLIPNMFPDSDWWMLSKFPKVIYWVWCCVIWNIVSASLGQLSCHTAPASYEPTHWQSMGTWSPWPRQGKHYLATAKTSVCCIINIILILIPKDCTVPVRSKKTELRVHSCTGAGYCFTHEPCSALWGTKALVVPSISTEAYSWHCSRSVYQFFF